ncbi:peptidylprolyl isomerase [Geothermobacter hydrogeniphilus]|uniref:PpiC domain-containing protein n=1 Tax=Geothermobacter hydrogeniphilus TaxID=1969733 RepID=A0A1X0Y8X3_9BACT|nr:peptidylprolyl isomerase [Geothermobacter hydrogeniphilus]ORJ61598.1 hypothetical protein B5V00_06050 [Geothermobacter hydrogeniphilus]
MSSTEQVVARVNGTPINRFDLDNAIQGYAMEQHRKTMDQLDADQLREAEDFALEKLVARELIFQEAMAGGFVADEQTIEEERQKIVANFPSEEEFAATLAKAGLDSESYRRMLRQDVTVNQFSEQQIMGLPEPDLDAVESFYREHPEQMIRRGRVRACHILVKAPATERDQAREKIEQLRQQATADNFADLARRSSDCPSATGGGDLGYFRRGDMVAEFEQAAFSQPVGEVGAPVETQFGFHLIMVLDREEDQRMSLEEARPQIVRFLQGQAGAEKLRAWVEQLRDKAVIELNIAVD